MDGLSFRKADGEPPMVMGDVFFPQGLKVRWRFAAMQWISKGICMVLTLCAGCNVAWGSFTDADSLYQDALAQIGRVPVDSCIKSFRDVLRVNRNFAPAYYQIAMLYMRLNSPSGRMRAEKMLKRAIRLEPDNREYQMGLGDLMWSQGFWSRARQQYEKVLVTSPERAEGAFKIGRYFLKEYIKYRDMTHFEGVRFEWRHFADDYYEKARAYFELAIRQDPTFRKAHFNLGLICLENGDPKRLIETMEELLAHFPGDKDALLFMALGYQTLGRNDLAYRFYDRALQQMDFKERTLMELVDLIAPKNGQVEEASELSPGVQRDAPLIWAEHDVHAGFWKKQDPLFLTEFNERRLEHYGRIAYANLRFGQPVRGLSGYRTPMGKTHIKFGRPLSKIVRRPALFAQVTLGARNLEPHLETWYYEGFEIVFRNWDGLDGWRFYVDPPFIPFNPEPSYLHVFNTTPPRYIDPYLDRKYSVPYQLAAFSDQQRIRVEVSYAVPLPRLAISQTDGLRHFRDGIFVFNQDWTEAYRNVGSFTHARPDSIPKTLRVSHPNQILGSHRVFLDPGLYHVAIEVIDPISGSIGTFRTGRSFTFSDSVLTMSDLLLAKHIEVQDPFRETRKDLKIVPNPNRTFTRSERLYVYLELYNLKRDEFGRTRFEITYQLAKPSKEEIDPARFVAVDLRSGRARLEIEELTIEEKLRRKTSVDFDVKYVPAAPNQVSSWIKRNYQEGNEKRIAVTARYEGNSEDDLTYLQLDISQVPEGIYRLTVAARDRYTGRTVEQYVVFRVADES